jgi:putative ABC transport system permease protein
VTRASATFAMRLAWRETRASWRTFLSFLACVTLGVAALTSVGTLAANLDRTLGREAKALLGGDIEIRAARPLDADVSWALTQLAASGAVVDHVRELVGMARAPVSGRTLLVELKAVPPSYPLYGRLETTPARAAGPLVDEGAVVVGPDLLERLGVSVGDRLALGAVELTIRGIVTREPDRPASVVALGPRISSARASSHSEAASAPGRCCACRRGRSRARRATRSPSPRPTPRSASSPTMMRNPDCGGSSRR